MKVLAIDIGGTFIKYAVVNNGIIEETWKKETGDFVDDTAFYDYLCRNLDDVECGCIGISCPGIIGNDGTILSKAAKNLHILYHSNIVVEVRNRTKKMTYVLNDAHAAGYCEYSLGSGKGEACAVYFIIGTGIGGCVCRENGIDVGASGMLGEFSFLPWKNETKEYGYYAHEAGIPNLVRYYNSYRKATDCTLGEEVFAAYQKKDSNAEKHSLNGHRISLPDF